MVYQNILEAIGNTPIIRLNKLPAANDADVLVKYEGVNIGGSIKTRTAYNMILEAERRGDIGPNTVIVEPTSGNQGIGLALVGAVKGYRTVIIMPDSVSVERRLLVASYGAEVILVEDKGNIGECVERCLNTALQMAEDDPLVFVPQQFVNPANPGIHRGQTAREIIAQVNGPIHGFCSGIGTGGTISGVGEVLRHENPDILIWALEPEKAAILSGGPISSHLQMGIGDGLIPENLNTEIYDEVVTVADEEALQIAKDLACKEGILCGISSGANVAVALRMASKLGKGHTVVTLLADTGERYFSTPLFDAGDA
ncbi:MAG: PLP-dependent cysteine synthase family protein [Coriobacteriia bacterium]|nr:PLP-dependent cysteine synthase family protein [Coriobacteriia bacterium]